MRIGSKVLAPPKPVTILIYREDGDGKPANIEFVCGAVLSYSEFEKLAPPPKPPLISNLKDGTQTQDFEDRRYKAKAATYNDLRVSWMILQSLSATPNLEWDTVNLQEPDTWNNYEKELKSFMTEAEYNRLVNAIVDANSPTKNRRQEALDVFTSTPSDRPAAEASDSHGEEPTITQSLELVNA